MFLFYEFELLKIFLFFYILYYINKFFKLGNRKYNGRFIYFFIFLMSLLNGNFYVEIFIIFILEIVLFIFLYFLLVSFVVLSLSKKDNIKLKLSYSFII